MPIINRMQQLTGEIAGWRQYLHTIPELGFEEVKTAAFVAERLREFGLTPETGVAKTGVVASIKRGTSDRHIALRADFDALPIIEASGVPHTSTHDGRMHACGHDGHTSMLLGAAKYLSETDCFRRHGYLCFPTRRRGRWRRPDYGRRGLV